MRAYIWYHICYPRRDLLFRRPMRRKEQMRYTFCLHCEEGEQMTLEQKNVVWPACHLQFVRCRCVSLHSTLPDQSRRKAPLVLMSKVDGLHGYMRRTRLSNKLCFLLVGCCLHLAWFAFWSSSASCTWRQIQFHALSSSTLREDISPVAVLEAPVAAVAFKVSLFGEAFAAKRQDGLEHHHSMPLSRLEASKIYDRCRCPHMCPAMNADMGKTCTNAPMPLPGRPCAFASVLQGPPFSWHTLGSFFRAPSLTVPLSSACPLMSFHCTSRRSTTHEPLVRILSLVSTDKYCTLVKPTASMIGICLLLTFRLSFCFFCCFFCNSLWDRKSCIERNAPGMFAA